MTTHLTTCIYCFHYIATSYHIHVTTGDKLGAGTDADVHLKIFGGKGDTGLMQLKNAINTSNKFERGRTDLFKMEASDIGKVRVSMLFKFKNPLLTIV